ncbi:MAG: flavodoxin [Atopobiaceae bacterium]
MNNNLSSNARDRKALTRAELLQLAGLGSAAGALMFLAGCAASTTDQASGDKNSAAVTANASSSSASTGDHKVLVAYYSATGHTRAVAERLSQDLDATLFEITPEEPYTADDLNFNNANSRVSQEHENQDQRNVPLSTTTPEDFDSYDTVLVGYPIWWGGPAWPINRFVSQNDWSNKRVITFCTSQMSGIGSTTKTQSDLAQSGTWEEGQRFSENVQDAEIDAFAEGLNL